VDVEAQRRVVQYLVEPAHLTSLRCDGTALRTLRWLSGDKDLPGLQQEGAPPGRTLALTLIQRFGSALNPNA
jgi:hypothetical protein